MSIEFLNCFSSAFLDWCSWVLVPASVTFGILRIWLTVPSVFDALFEHGFGILHRKSTIERITCQVEDGRERSKKENELFWNIESLVWRGFESDFLFLLQMELPLRNLCFKFRFSPDDPWWRSHLFLKEKWSKAHTKEKGNLRGRKKFKPYMVEGTWVKRQTWILTQTLLLAYSVVQPTWVSK